MESFTITTYVSHYYERFNALSSQRFEVPFDDASLSFDLVNYASITVFMVDHMKIEPNSLLLWNKNSSKGILNFHGGSGKYSINAVNATMEWHKHESDNSNYLTVIFLKIF